MIYGLPPKLTKNQGYRFVHILPFLEEILAKRKINQAFISVLLMFPKESIKTFEPITAGQVLHTGQLVNDINRVR